MQILIETYCKVENVPPQHLIDLPRRKQLAAKIPCGSSIINCATWVREVDRENWEEKFRRASATPHRITVSLLWSVLHNCQIASFRLSGKVALQLFDFSDGTFDFMENEPRFLDDLHIFFKSIPVKLMLLANMVNNCALIHSMNWLEYFNSNKTVKTFIPLIYWITLRQVNSRYSQTSRFE